MVNMNGLGKLSRLKEFHDMKEYIQIAKKYLVTNSSNLIRGICFTIRDKIGISYGGKSHE